MTENWLVQSQSYHQKHRIEDNQSICFGFRDAGRGTPIGDDGQPATRPRREIIVARQPARGTRLAAAIAEAHRAAAGMNEAAVIDYLNSSVGQLMRRNDPQENKQIIKVLVRQGGSSEIDLDQLIAAGTGVCRHRALLFKVLADQLGLRVALVRGNYVRRGADRRPGDLSGSMGGHAWNEVLLASGERILVDPMHVCVADLSDPMIASYADVNGKQLYSSTSGEDDRGVESREPAGGGLEALSFARWVSASRPTGERFAYAYTDVIDAETQGELQRALQRGGIAFDHYRTGLGARGSKRPVIRVRGLALLLLSRQLKSVC